MYKGYWPNAVVWDKGKIVRMFTYDSCFSLKEAKKCIDKWNEIYEGGVLSSYIEHSWDKRRVCCKFYEETLRKLEYACEL